MKKNNKKGFTLVELVIVVAVMAILVAIAIPTVSSITKTAKTAVDDTNAKTIESMIKLAEADAAKAGNGTATLGDEAIAKALVDAKLGITGTFHYVPATGTVSTSAPGAGVTAKTITCSTTGVKVGAMTAELAWTAVSGSTSTPSGEN